MKNKEKYIDFLVKCATDNESSFGVDKVTGEPKICCSFSSKDEINCLNCKFGNTICKPKNKNRMA